MFGSLLAAFRDSISVLSSENSPSVLRVTPEDGTDTLCRNVANKLPPYAAQHPGREKTSAVPWWHPDTRKEENIYTCREFSPCRPSRNQSPCLVSYNRLQRQECCERGIIVLVQKLMLALSCRKFREIYGSRGSSKVFIRAPILSQTKPACIFGPCPPIQTYV